MTASAGKQGFSPQEKEQLIAKAREAMSHAYAPYSDFHVGAALVTADGKVFTGCNVENASYGLTICAERTAICSAIAQTSSSPQGKLAIRAIAVVNSANQPCSPCGACRQFIAEFGPEIVVIYQDASGMKEMTSRELLPDGFSL
jgi:cytidine deaminase